MMIRKNLMLLLGLLLIASCKQDQLLLYEQSSDIYFNYYSSVSVNANLSERSDSSVFSFALIWSEVKDSVIQIPVQIIGATTDYDREFITQIDPSSTAQQGKHYDALGKCVIPAGQIKGNVSIKIHRTPDLLEAMPYIRFKLLPNDEFSTNYAYWKMKVTDTASVDNLQFKLIITDIITKPKGWVSMERSLGLFSRVKLELLCSLFDLEMTAFDKTGPFAPVVMNYAAVLKLYLAVQKEEGNTVYDENGIEVTVP